MASTSTSRIAHRTLKVLAKVAVFLVVFIMTMAFTSGVAAQEIDIDPIFDGGGSTETPAAADEPEPSGLPASADPVSPDDTSLIQPTEPTEPDEPDVGISIESSSTGLTQTVVIILLLTIGSVAPSLLLLATSFTRFVIVLGLTRNAMGTQQIPPTQVLTGLALILTFFVMGPTFSEINEVAVQPLLAGEIEQGEAFDAGFAPLREFMLAQTDDEDIRLFLDIRDEQPASAEEVSASVLVPAFVLSELRTAFTIGFVIFIPFLVIDLVISSVLMSLGMVMLPPVFVSLPVKLLLFVLVDGWGLIVVSLVSSVNTT